MKDLQDQQDAIKITLIPLYPGISKIKNLTSKVRHSLIYREFLADLTEKRNSLPVKEMLQQLYPQKLSIWQKYQREIISTTIGVTVVGGTILIARHKINAANAKAA